MGFFKELKEDFSQAMNELMPEDDLYKEDFLEGTEDEIEDDSSNEKVAEDGKDYTHAKSTNDKRDIKDILEEEVLAAIEALNTNEELPEESNLVEVVEGEPNHEVDLETNKDFGEELLEDGLTEEELIQRMIDEDERLEKEQQAKEQELKEQENKENQVREKELEEQRMAEFGDNKELETQEDSSDMELIAQLLGEDNNEDADVDEEILAKSDEVEEMKEDFEIKEDMHELGNDVTVITKGTKINGSISSDGSLEVMGTITGDINCLGKLSIVGNVSGNSQASEIYVNTARLDGGLVSTGSVKVGVGTIVVGDVKANSAVIAGAVKGEVDVNGPVIIDSTAIVKGNINAKSVQINNGAVIDGYCSLTYAAVDIDNFFDGEK